MPKPQSKTQKKLDNKIRETLTQLCEDSFKDLPGFCWVTHQAEYSNFPASLLIICVFDTEADKQHNIENGALATIQKQIHAKLLKIGVVLKKVDKQVVADSEEACEQEHGGNWSLRLKDAEGRAVPKNHPSK